MKFVLSHIILLAIISYNSSTNINQQYRLDKFIQPENYQIYLKFGEDFNKTRTFLIEKCSIKVNIIPNLVSSNISSIRLHYFDIRKQENNVTLMDKNGVHVAIKVAQQSIETGIVEIQLINSKMDVVNQPYTIEFTNITGKIRDDNYGVYVGEYDFGSQKKLMIGTTFRPSQARSAFPCFDEPSMKANFQISLTVPRSFKTVIGNSRKLSEEDIIGCDLKRVQFETTPEVATYQVAFLIATFEQISNNNFNIYCSEGNIPYAQYAANITPKVVKKLEKIMKLNYTELRSPELNQAALPTTFVSLEYFGLIFYLETEFLYDAAKSTVEELQYLFVTIARSIALMWFYNFGSVEWWSHTWLIEGLVTYLSSKIGAEIVPELEVDKLHVMQILKDTLDVDSSVHSLPLTSKEEDIYNVSFIVQKSDHITFYKSIAISFMMDSIMGKEKFFAGLRKLSDTLKGGSVNPTQFFEAFESEGLPRGKMREWTEESGYPVVTVKRDKNNAILSQKRFLLESNKRSITKWHVPITFASRVHNVNFGNITPSHWLSPNKDLVIPDAFNGSDWIIVNINQFGYYRVNYEESLWPHISQVLNSENFGGIPAIIRARLIDDVLSMARIMRQSYNLAMDVTKYLVKETEYYPWAAAYNAFSFLLKRIGKRTELRNLLKKHVASLSQNVRQTLYEPGVNADTPIDLLKTALVMRWFYNNDYSDYSPKAKRMFDAYKLNPVISASNVNYQYSMICYGVKFGTTSDWNFVFDQYKKSNFSYEKTRMLQALGCTKEPVILLKFLEMTLDPISNIKKHDNHLIFKAVLKSNMDIAQTFLEQNIEDISRTYASWNALSTMIKLLADRFTTVAQIEEIFVENNQVSLKEAAGDIAQSSLKAAEANVKWLATFEDELYRWLSHEVTDAAASSSPVLVLLLICLSIVLYNS